MDNSFERPHNKVLLILMLGALNTITPISIDMYLPAFPNVAAEMHTEIAKVSLSVSSYFLGFAVGQILFGPLLDRFGRLRPLYFGLSVYIISTLACMITDHIVVFWIIRFVQALSGCVAAVAAIAMVLDFFPPEKSARIISLLILILGVSPLLAPTAGGFIVATWGWRYIFFTLAAISLLMLVAIYFFLPEGHPPDKTVSLKPKPILSSFLTILLNPQFFVYAFAGTFSFAGLFVYVAGSPAVFMGEFHLSPKVYGGVFAVLSIGFIGGSQLNHLFARQWRHEVILRVVIMGQVIIGMVFLALAGTGLLGLISTISFLFALLACSGLTYPNAAALALNPFKKNAGSASALLGCIQIGIGGLVSTGVGMLALNSILAVALLMTVSAAIALVIFLLGTKLVTKKYAL